MIPPLLWFSWKGDRKIQSIVGPSTSPPQTWDARNRAICTQWGRTPPQRNLSWRIRHRQTGPLCPRCNCWATSLSRNCILRLCSPNHRLSWPPCPRPKFRHSAWWSCARAAKDKMGQWCILAMLSSCARAISSARSPIKLSTTPIPQLLSAFRPKWKQACRLPNTLPCNLEAIPQLIDNRFQGQSIAVVLGRYCGNWTWAVSIKFYFIIGLFPNEPLRVRIGNERGRLPEVGLVGEHFKGLPVEDAHLESPRTHVHRTYYLFHTIYLQIYNSHPHYNHLRTRPHHPNKYTSLLENNLGWLLDIGYKKE